MSTSCKSLDALLQITVLPSLSVQHLELERKGIASLTHDSQFRIHFFLTFMINDLFHQQI